MTLLIIKKHLLLFLLLFFACLLSAQDKAVQQSILYLKDGSIVYGKLVQEQTDYVIWELTGGDQIKVKNERIQSFERIPAEVQVFKTGQQRKKRGIYGTVHGGVFFSKYDNPWNNQSHAPSLNVSVGYRFHPWLAVGVGTGFDNYDYHLVPIFAELRGDIVSGAITPYYQLALGYGFTTKTVKDDFFRGFTYNGGWMAHPAVGMKFYTKNRNAFLVEFGYRIQQTNKEYDSENIKPERWTLRRAAMRVGMEF